MGNVSETTTFAWVIMGIVLVLVISTIDGYVGGWLLLALVVSMMYAAHDKQLL